MKATSGAFFILASLTLLLTGCSAYSEMVAYRTGTRVTQEQERTLVVGISTKDDVEKTLGAPQKIEQVESEETHYIYNYSELNSAFSGKGNISESKRFVFDKKTNKLRKILKGAGDVGNPLTGYQ